MRQVEPTPGQFFRVEEVKSKASPKTFIKVTLMARGQMGEEIRILSRLVDRGKRVWETYGGMKAYMGPVILSHQVTQDDLNETFYILKKLHLQEQLEGMVIDTFQDLTGDYPSKRLGDI